MSSLPNKRTVLVVDDDAECLEAISAALETAGYEVVRATDGGDGLREAMARFLKREPPSLILLDLRMPTIDGWQFVAAQKQFNGFAAIPVLIVSAESELRQIAGELGVVGYLQKPLDLPTLVSTVGRHCAS